MLIMIEDNTFTEEDQAFQKILEKFCSVFDKSFPTEACSCCGILVLPRLVRWIQYNPKCDYFLQSLLEMLLHTRETARNGKQVAVCTKCQKSPSRPPYHGIFPFMLPQRARVFFSPLILQTSLGRTQGAGDLWGPYHTYRTVTGNYFYYY